MAIKTNIKMRVTPEQSKKVQEICFKGGINWGYLDDIVRYIEEPYILVDKKKYLSWLGENQSDSFIGTEEEEIDPELFIKTNGTCIEKKEYQKDTIDFIDGWNSAKNPLYEQTKDLNENSKPIQYQIGIDTFQRAKANLTKDELIACVKFNIDKYNWRKKGQDVEDFKKIIDYANFAIEILGSENATNK